MFQVMDNDHDMRVSIEELKTVLGNTSQGRKKMNSTLFRNLVEKSEKVNFSGASCRKVNIKGGSTQVLFDFLNIFWLMTLTAFIKSLRLSSMMHHVERRLTALSSLVWS